MAGLTKCLKKLGLSAHEAALLKGSVKEYLDDGYEAHRAATQAVQDYLADLTAERDGIVEQIQKQIVAKNVEKSSEATAKEIAPAASRQLYVEFAGQRHPVDSFKDASEKWDKFRETTMAGASEIGEGVKIFDQDGNEVARVAYNGRVFPPGGWKSGVKPLYEPAGRSFSRPSNEIERGTVDQAAHTAATSTQNDLPQPTEAQKEAGNYAKGHVTIGGLEIAVENPEGSKRRPEWPPLKSHYGYFKRSEGKDGDQVDVFIKPSTPEDYSGPVFVVDQTNKDGAFDEGKVMLGWPDEASARAGYLENYTPGWTGLGAIKQFTLPEFKLWIKAGDTKNPVALKGKKIIAKPKPESPTAAPVAESKDAAVEKKAESGNTEDSGSELTANKRNRVTRLSWDDIKDKDAALRVRETVKSKVYPRPDYQAMVDGGMQPLIAHIVKQAYDAIAAKPNTRTAPTDAQLESYIDGVNRYMDGVMAWANDRDKVGAFILKLAGKAKVLSGTSSGIPTSMSSMVEVANRSLMETVYPDGWRNHIETVRIIGGNKSLAALQPSTNEAVKAMNEIGKGWPASQEAWQRRGYRVVNGDDITASVYAGTRTDGTKYAAINYKLGNRTVKTDFVEGAESESDKAVQDELKAGLDDVKGHYVLLDKNNRPVGAFNTESEAQDKARELTAHKGKSTISDKGISVESAERVGSDRRMDGEDVSSDKLRETFGFKGVNFGNWMKGKSNEAERQLHLNHAYDAFMDLTDMMGVPPKAMSLNGMLGLAIGAQGTGQYAAHFVPGVNEINLTRTNGAGSLAHEFAHAVDHYFARLAGLERKADPFLTSNVSLPHKSLSAELRQEIFDSFKSIVKSMNTREQTEAERNLGREISIQRAEKNVAGWLKSIRADFVREKVDEKKFDALAERIKSLDLGDGMVAVSGSTALHPAIAELRELYKTASGRLYSLERMIGMQNNVDHLKYLKSGKAQASEHVPQMPTDYSREAAKLDKDKGGKPYWNTPWEKFARAFDAFISDRLEAKAAKNTYLSHAGRDGETVPKGEERKAINAAFDKLVGELKTKETDQGTALFQPTKEYNTDDEYRQAVLDFERGEPDQSQAGPAGEAARRDAVAALDDLRSADSLLALTLSSDLAARQRVNLTGHSITSPADLAALAQVYRDTRFETFRVIFVNDQKKVVSQIGLTSRLPTTTEAVIGNDAKAYLKELWELAQKSGATGYYLLHNHPSGTSMASQADRTITQRIAARMPGFAGHVIIDTNEYTVIDRGGFPVTTKKKFPQAEIFNRPSEYTDVVLDKPQAVMSMAKRLAADQHAIAFIVTDNQLRVTGVTQLPAAAFKDPSSTRVAMIRALRIFKGSRFFAVGTDYNLLEKIGEMGLVVDAVHISGERAVSLGDRGVFQPNTGNSPFPHVRMARVSPDTSSVFDQMRRNALEARKADNLVVGIGSQAVEQEEAPYRAGETTRPAAIDGVAPGLVSAYRARARKVIDRIDKALDPLGALPENKEYLAKRYLTLGRIAKADEIAKGIGKAFGKATPEDRVAVYDYLTTREARPNGIQNELVRAEAVKVKRLIESVSDAMVARGLLSEETAEAHRGAYLPQLYLKWLLNDADVKLLGSGKKPGPMGYLKGRKIERTTGPDGETRFVWRETGVPLTDAQVLDLGPISDPGFLAATAIATPVRDMALLDFLSSISQNEKWVLPNSLVDFDGTYSTPQFLKTEADRLRKQADHYAPEDAKATRAIADRMDTAANKALGALAGDFKQYREIPNTAKYGRLRGLWVRKEIYGDLVGVYDLSPKDPGFVQSLLGYGGIGTKVTQLWKMGKVALNPPAQVRNFVSNGVLLQLSGVPLHKLPGYMKRALNEVVDNGKYWQIAKKYGVTESTFATQELYRIRRDLLDLEMREGRLNPIGKLHRMGAIVADGASDAYQFSEAWYKTAKIMHAMDSGMSEAEAAIEAQKWLFDYSLVPKSVRYLRNLPYGMPFITFQYKVLPRLAEVAVLHPQRLIPWVALFAGWPLLWATIAGEDDDEYKRLQKALPPWLQERGHAMILPWQDEDGRSQVLDMGYFMPWSMYTDIVGDLARGELGEAVQTTGIFSGPVNSVAIAMMTGKDPFTKRDIMDPGDPLGRQFAAATNYAWDMMMPPIVSSRGLVSPMGLVDQEYGGKAVQAITGRTNKYGDPTATGSQAGLYPFGLNVYSIEPQHSTAQNVLRLKYEADQTEQTLKRKLQNRALSEDARKAIVQEYTDEMKRRYEKIEEYGKP
jgi:Inorganic Pyrophosphatase/Large polyvalent protein-associated domain 1/RadC-like JAB domain